MPSETLRCRILLEDFVIAAVAVDDWGALVDPVFIVVAVAGSLAGAAVGAGDVVGTGSGGDDLIHNNNGCSFFEVVVPVISGPVDRRECGRDALRVVPHCVRRIEL